VSHRPAPLALAVAWLAIGAGVAAADAQWPPSGTPIATGVGDQAGVVLTGDGAGGAIFAWLDGTTAPPRIRALRMLHSGAIAPGWVAGGNTVLVEPASASEPRIAPDGAGGAFVVWQDMRNDPQFQTANYDLFAQHLLADGSVAPGWPAGGLAVCTAPRRQTQQQMIADGAGGMVVVWGDYRDDPSGYTVQALYALRMNGDGTIPTGWNVNGNRIAASGASPALVPDGTGGAVFGWHNYPAGGTTGAEIYGQRLLGSGAIAPGWPPDGEIVCGAPRDQKHTVMLEDGAGGAYYSWYDERANDTREHLYAQHVTGTGALAPHWPAYGLPIAGFGQNQINQSLVTDGAGGFIAVWMDYRSANSPINPGNIDLYAQKVTSSGGTAWAPEGMEVCIQTSSQWYPAAAADGAGGILVTWLDTRLSSNPIFLQHLGGGGLPMPGFTLNGVLVPEAGYGATPSMIGDDHGGVILAWQAYGSWGDEDVFAAHADGVEGTADVEAPRAPDFTLEAVRPNPVRDAFVVGFALREAVPATIELLDLAGRRVDSREVGAFGPGRQSAAFDAHALAPGIYLVRLRQGTYSEVKRISVMR
jgi:hypothetical protein